MNKRIKKFLLACSGWKERYVMCKKWILALIVFALIIIVPVMFVFGDIASEMAKMKKATLKTGEVVDGIYAGFNDYVDFYLIKYNDGYIAIDSGVSEEAVFDVLKELNINNSEVKVLFLTHSDQDHVGGLSVFKNAKVYISNIEEKLITGEIKRRFTAFKIPVRNRIDSEYEIVKDGDRIEIGERTVECVLTPGHTPGSMSFIVDGKYIFSGDLLKIEDREMKTFVKGFTMDIGEDLKSVNKIKEKVKRESIKYIFSAHHGMLKIND